MRLFSYLASTNWFGHLLFLTGLRQDVFLQDEMFCEELTFDEKSCSQCGICKDVCPLALDLPMDLHKRENSCIYCLYCYSSCPDRSIKFSGSMGFFEEQLRQYDFTIRKLYLTNEDLDT